MFVFVFAAFVFADVVVKLFCAAVVEVVSFHNCLCCCG